MFKATRAFQVLLLATCLSGCGTMLNTLYFIPDEGGMRPYGGVKVDAQVVHDSIADASRAKNAADSVGSAGWVVFWVADLPLSALGDTLTLPWTLNPKYREPLVGRHGREDQPASTTSPAR